MELVSRRRSPPAPCRRGPRTRSYPLFLGIRFSRFPGRLAPRPAASFRPRRKEIYYAHPLPRSRGFPAFFPEKGRLMGRFRRTTWGDALLLPFGPRTHSLHKPRKGAGRRECDPAFRGASPQGAPRRRGLPPQGDSLRPTATPLAMQRGRATLVAPGLSNR